MARMIRKKTTKKPTRKPPAKARTAVLVSTRKGAWIYQGDPGRRGWTTNGPHFLGHVINHMVLDPRDRRTLLAAAKTGHLGPTIFRSTDLGRTRSSSTRAIPRISTSPCPAAACTRPGTRAGPGRRW